MLKSLRDVKELKVKFLLIRNHIINKLNRITLGIKYWLIM